MELHGHAEPAEHHVVVAVLGAQRLVGHLQAWGAVHRAVDPGDLGAHTRTRTRAHTRTHTRTIAYTQSRTHTRTHTHTQTNRDGWFNGNSKDVFSVQLIG